MPTKRRFTDAQDKVDEAMKLIRPVRGWRWRTTHKA